MGSLQAVSLVDNPGTSQPTNTHRVLFLTERNQTLLLLEYSPLEVCHHFSTFHEAPLPCTMLSDEAASYPSRPSSRTWNSKDDAMFDMALLHLHDHRWVSLHDEVTVGTP